jgi:hypothetical protein
MNIVTIIKAIAAALPGIAAAIKLLRRDKEPQAEAASPTDRSLSELDAIREWRRTAKKPASQV